jgi:hypothetical protein
LLELFRRHARVKFLDTAGLLGGPGNIIEGFCPDLAEIRELLLDLLAAFQRNLD